MLCTTATGSSTLVLHCQGSDVLAFIPALCGPEYGSWCGPLPRRAAAHSKLGNYTEATCDCERAIGIDPTYSKAYGRMG